MKQNLEHSQPWRAAPQAVTTALVASWPRLWREQLLQVRVQTTSRTFRVFMHTTIIIINPVMMVIVVIANTIGISVID
jgi:hypothetical protein